MVETTVFAAQVTGGLLAGVFFSFAVAVMPGLRGAGDHTFVETMQRINAAIVNPAFLLVFLGAPALAVAAGVVDRTFLGYAAAALGVVTLLVTVAMNIPLNNRLDAGSSDDAAAVRAPFEDPWVRWNLLRSLTGVGSFVCLLLL